MSEETVKKTEQKTQTQETKNEDKLFTQEEVNSIVSSRVNKEKEKFLDYDSLKEKSGLYDNLLNEKKNVSDQLESANKILQKTFDDLIGKVSEDKKSLIPDELNLSQKVSYITRNFGTLISDNNQQIQTNTKVLPIQDDKNKLKQERVVTEYDPREFVNNPEKLKEYIKDRKQNKWS